MAEVTFIYNTIPTVIQCKKTDEFKDIIQKFAIKAEIKLKDIHFVYDAKIVDINLTFEQIAKESDKKSGKINVLVISNDDDTNQETKEISKDIICPKCKENCFIKLNEYKMSLECNKGHKLDDILFNEFNNNQKVDLSKIICEDCKKVNKFSTYEHQFFRCLTCKKNICPLCKSKHNKNHDIIDYNQKYYICSNHNENFSSYCKKCKINLCITCESNHKDKENIILYRDLLPKKDLIKSQLSDLRTKIDKYKEIINKFKQDLDNIIFNFEIYYSINDNLLKNYDLKKRNYQMLTNIKEIVNNNDKILSDLKFFDLEKEQSFNLYHKTLALFNKMKNNKTEKDLNWYKKFLYLFMLNERVENNENSIEFMKKIINESNNDCKVDEKNLILDETRNSARADRIVMDAIKNIEDKERKKENSLFLPFILEYKNIILDELNEKCRNAINLIESKYLPNEKDNESKGDILRYLADYYRYLIQFADGSLKNQLIEKCKNYYLEAETILKGFSCLNYTKIGLLLNYSVFCKDILKDSKEAIKIAKSAILNFEEKQKKFNIKNDDEKYENSFKTYEFLKDNLNTWEEESKKK